MTGNAETRRIYIGGLYSAASETDVRKLVARFGDVDSVELRQHRKAATAGDSGAPTAGGGQIAQQSAGSMYAFVSVRTSEDRLQKCFRQLGGSSWHGHRLNLQLAREPFLARLARERQQQRGQQQSASASTTGSSSSSSKSTAALDRQLSIMRQVLAGTRRGRRQLLDASGDEKNTASINTDAGAVPGGGAVSDVVQQAQGVDEAVVDFTADDEDFGQRCDVSAKSLRHEEGNPVDAEAGSNIQQLCGGLAMFAGLGALEDATKNVISDQRTHPKSDRVDDRRLLSRLEGFSACWNDTAASSGFDGQREPMSVISQAAVIETSSSRDTGARPVAGVTPQSRDRQRQDNERRMQSVRRMCATADDRKHAVKMALQSTSPNSGGINKKIRFTCTSSPSPIPEDDNEPDNKCDESPPDVTSAVNPPDDERFRLDARFADGGGRVCEKKEGVSRSELHNQMRILGDIVGRPLSEPVSSSRAPVEHVRFDPTLSEHTSKYERKPLAADAAATSVASCETTTSADNRKDNSGGASSEATYKVTGDLRALFDNEEKTNIEGHAPAFSLLQMMGRAAPDVAANTRRRSASASSSSSSATSLSDRDDVINDVRPARGDDVSWSCGTGSFLLTANDPRLQEGTDFLLDSSPVVDETERQQRREQLVEMFRTQRRRLRRQEKQQVHKQQWVPRLKRPAATRH